MEHAGVGNCIIDIRGNGGGNSNYWANGIVLPNTGIVYRFSAEEGLNADGSINEETGTTPDIIVKSSKDAWEACLAAIRGTERGV